MLLNYGIFKRCIQPILNIHRFYICGFLYSENSLVTPKSIPWVFLWSFTDVSRMVKALSHPPYKFLDEVDQGELCLLHSSFRLYTNAFSVVLFNVTLFTLLCHFLLVISPLRMAHCIYVLKCNPVFLKARRL